MTKPASTPVPKIDQGAELWALVERAQDGDTTAFGTIYERTVDSVHRYLYFRTGRRELAEDLTADTFLRALKRIGSLRPEAGSPLAWLYTIARNLVVDYYKSGAYRFSIPVGDSRDAVAGDETDMLGPEDGAVLRWDELGLWSAVKRLTPEQCDVVVMRFMQGFSVREIAQKTGSTESAVKAMQYRAVRSLSRDQLLAATFAATA